MVGAPSLRLWIDQAPGEEEAAGPVVADHEEERVVGAEHLDFHARELGGHGLIATPVAAAASVPFSLTSTYAL